MKEHSRVVNIILHFDKGFSCTGVRIFQNSLSNTLKIFAFHYKSILPQREKKNGIELHLAILNLPSAFPRLEQMSKLMEETGARHLMLEEEVKHTGAP